MSGKEVWGLLHLRDFGYLTTIKCVAGILSAQVSVTNCVFDTVNNALLPWWLYLFPGHPQ